MIDFNMLKPKIKELALKHQLSLVVLFGSQATGKTHPKSDVDFACLSKKPARPMDIARIAEDFSEKLGIKNLELVFLNGAYPFLLKQIAQKSKILYEEEPSLFAKFKIYAVKRFLEEKKLLDLREMSLNKFLQKV